MSATVAALLQLGLLVGLLAAVYVPFGNYLAAVYTSDRHWRVERAVYRVVRVDPDSQQHWSGYAAAVLAFSFLSVVLLYLLQALGMSPGGLKWETTEATLGKSLRRRGFRGETRPGWNRPVMVW